MRGYILVALNLFCQDLGQGDILPWRPPDRRPGAWCQSWSVVHSPHQVTRLLTLRAPPDNISPHCNPVYRMMSNTKTLFPPKPLFLIISSEGQFSAFFFLLRLTGEISDNYRHITEKYLRLALHLIFWIKRFLYISRQCWTKKCLKSRTIQTSGINQDSTVGCKVLSRCHDSSLPRPPNANIWRDNILFSSTLSLTGKSSIISSALGTGNSKRRQFIKTIGRPLVLLIFTIPQIYKFWGFTNKLTFPDLFQLPDNLLQGMLFFVLSYHTVSGVVMTKRWNESKIGLFRFKVAIFLKRWPFSVTV